MLQNTFNPHKWFISIQSLLLLNKSISNACIKQQNNSVGDMVYIMLYVESLRKVTNSLSLDG
jgi:hypothetical protein